MSDNLLTIGRFARATGLSVDTLRHWDAEGLVVPAEVDPATGYRRYRPDQAAQARAVAALRDLELSIPAVRALLDADDAGVRADILRTERTRLEARTARLQRALHRLSVLATTAAAVETAATPSPVATPATAHKEIRVPTPPPPPALDAETHRALGKGLFNRTWDLLEIEARTTTQDDEMIDTAHASAWHWRQVGTVANVARGHWMCARVYAVLGRGEPALHHARRAVAILAAGGDGIEDWDDAAAAEAMARALVVTGDLTGAAEWKARGVVALAGIVHEADRRVIEADLATLPV